MAGHRAQLVDDYAKHFARLNETLDTRAMSTSDFRALSRTYGGVLGSLSPGARILDLGCGIGYLLNWL